MTETPTGTPTRTPTRTRTCTLSVSTDNLDEARERLSWRDDDGDNNAPSIPTRTSPRKRTPRAQRSWRDGEKENRTLKSHGIAPINFYGKRPSDLKTAHHQVEEQLKETMATVETNLLIQQKEQHREQLENLRKPFRLITSLKTWPLQDMAMEHLDHLLGKHSDSQFHGGDYLSSESASSVASAGEGKRRTSPSSKQRVPEYLDNFASRTTEPLWSQEPRIFATEKAQGKRRYLVGHFGRIADWYWRKSSTKHLYEVIREQTPCRMYFDLEYAKAYNPDVDETALLDEFRDELAADLFTHLNVTLEVCQIIDLDSSTEAKFSRHWMLDLKDGLFEDAPTVGRFIKRLVSRLAEELATGLLKDRRPTLAKHLFVQTKDPSKTSCFIDLGVYTRNRLFRCFASSKFGKNNILELSDVNEYPIDLPPKQLPSPKSTLEDYVNSNNWEPHARALADTLVVPLGGSEGKRIFKVEPDESTIRSQGSHNTNRVVYHPAIPIRTSKTPLPSLDKYIVDVLACRGGVPGAIRAWSLEYGPRDVPVSITYQLSRNRYCELIGRSHKSNNIYWTVLFGSWTCVQGCHDPECFGRGSPSAIPKDRVNVLEEEYEKWQEEEFEKALLALNLDDPQPPPTTSSAITTTTPTTIQTEDGNNVVTGSSKTILAMASEKQGQAQGATEADIAVHSSCLLSDDALLDAMLANPELFP